MITTTEAPAMSNTGQVTLATVEALYAAFDELDTEAALACFHDDIEISQSEELPWGGTYRGKEEALVFFGTSLSHIQTKVRIERFVVAGDTVVEIARVSGAQHAHVGPQPDDHDLVDVEVLAEVEPAVRPLLR